MPHNKGMDWISLHQRMRVYLRDHFDCVWCRMVFPPPELGHALSLDHVDGRSNETSNLVTCCLECNSSRKGLSAEEYAHILGRRMFEHPQIILARVYEAIAKPLPARELGVELARARRPKYHAQVNGQRRRG